MLRSFLSQVPRLQSDVPFLARISVVEHQKQHIIHTSKKTPEYF